MIFLCFVATFCTVALAAPSDNSYVVASDEPLKEIEKDTRTEFLHPIIYAMDIKSNISNRFARTLVVSKVKNGDIQVKEATFTAVLPEKAFISEFVMEIGGKSYKAYVKGKQEAKDIYSKAVASGQSAGHVEVSARDSNRFTVSVNIEPESKASFLLTYEELLERKNDQYELVLNIHPGQIVKSLNVEVSINESRPLKFVKTPSLRSGNEISKNSDKLNPSSDIQLINSTSAVVKFHPDAEQQRQFAKEMGVKENQGLAGQFVVQYEVERDPSGGEVLLQDGYFVHFFAPEDLEPLPKQVVFVLDTSGSMDGRKINQLKDAMKSILNEIREGDVINIVEFNSDVFVWDIETEKSTRVEFNNYQEPYEDLLLIKKSCEESSRAKANMKTDSLEILSLISLGTSANLNREILRKATTFSEEQLYYSQEKQLDYDHIQQFNNLEELREKRERDGLQNVERNVFLNTLPAASTANNETLKKAKQVIENMESTGATNIIGGLETGLHLIKLNRKANDEKVEHQPMIIFLTDGQPNVGVSSTEEITEIVTRLNLQNDNVPIFSLSFGNGADKAFLRKLSSKNSGFSRHIYEASDASLQLQEFYRIISSPLLSNVVFKYDAEVEAITETHFPIFFRGSEFVITGRYAGSHLPIEVNALGPKGPIILTPKTTSPVTSLERLWAYLTLKQKLAERESADNKTVLTQQALDLALKYSFVTEVSSLVVVKPNETSAVDTEDASNKPSYFGNYGFQTLSAPVSKSYFLRSDIQPLASFSGHTQYSALSGPRQGVDIRFDSDTDSMDYSWPGAFPDRIPTTTVTPKLKVPSSSVKPKLETLLPWLVGVLDANKSLNISGGVYELGEHASIAAGLDCPKTPLNGSVSGECSLLKDCPEVFTYLTDFQEYQKYFCPMQNKYAGVCCPKKTTP